MSISPVYIPPASSSSPSTESSVRDRWLRLDYLDQPVGPVLRVGVVAGEAHDWACQGIFEAHCLLYRLHQQGQQPAAILCAPQLRDGSALGWRKLIQADPELRSLPFFVVGEPEQWPERSAAQEMGIDDCFAPEVSAADLQQRIAFLQTHKSQLDTLLGTHLPQPQHRISPLKRAMDLLISGMLLVFLSPLLVFFAFRLRIRSKGPVFVKLPRVGRGYQLIDCLAFRGGDQPKSRWWRHLPRLWNVFRGDLSLVGNRPLALDEAQTLTTDQWAGRFLAPTGLTGPWRVAHLRGQPLSLAQQRDLEVAYARQPGLRKDLRWLLRTLSGWLVADRRA